jgi:hypothetical protein
MGNLVASLSSIVVPIGVEAMIIPWAFHPYRLGTIPWIPPSNLKVWMVRWASNLTLMLLILLITMSMSSLRHCKQWDLKANLLYGRWFLLGFVLSRMILGYFEFIRAPLLALMPWAPYADLTALGLVCFPIVLLMGAMGTNRMLRELCPDQETR